MIRKIHGELITKDQDFCVVMVNGLGYQVYIPKSIYHRLPKPDEQLELYTHLVVREDELTLYGFLDNEELSMFELLLSVSGIGPKVGLVIVGTLSPTDFYLAVLNDKISALTHVPGIGKKSAQRLVLELKEKVKTMTTTSDKLGETSPEGVEGDNIANQSIITEVIDALTSLGYSEEEADMAMAEIQDHVTEEMEIEQILKLALQRLKRD